MRIAPTTSGCKSVNKVVASLACRHIGNFGHRRRTCTVSCCNRHTHRSLAFSTRAARESANMDRAAAGFESTAAVVWHICGLITTVREKFSTDILLKIFNAVKWGVSAHPRHFSNKRYTTWMFGISNSDSKESLTMCSFSNLQLQLVCRNIYLTVHWHRKNQNKKFQQKKIHVFCLCVVCVWENSVFKIIFCSTRRSN